MTDITCPLCGKPNPPEQDECLYCQAPLKGGGFIAPAEPAAEGSQVPPSEKPGEEAPPARPDLFSSLEDAVPDWLKETEASFLESPAPETEGPTPEQISDQIDALINQPPASAEGRGPAIDDDWLASLLAEAGLNEPSMEDVGAAQDQGGIELEPTVTSPDAPEEELPIAPEQVQKPDWVSDLEAGSTIKLEGGMPPGEPPDRGLEVSETTGQEGPGEVEIPDWVGKPVPEPSTPSAQETEKPLAPADLPGWLEALRPSEDLSPSEPVEDLTTAEIVKAGPLVGLRGVISAHPSAIRARKPPTYSIKLRVTDEQHARVEMMEELLANEQKPKPLPSKPIISSRNITRLVVALVLILPVIWAVFTGSQRVPPPQPNTIPGVVNFTQSIQRLPVGAPVLLAFDYEAGFSGEMNLAISTAISQLLMKNAFMTLVTTTSSGAALAESLMNASLSTAGMLEGSSSYTNLGYIPGGTLGLLGLANSPKAVLPYSLDGDNVWAVAPLNTISSVADFNAVLLITNDPDNARSWIEQVGPLLQEAGTPLLIITSAQAEPLVRPYYEAVPAQVQGMVSGLAGGLAYAQTTGGLPQNGTWDAFSVGVTVSGLVILAGAITGVVVKMTMAKNKKES
jgi:hypothetical protein